MNKEHLKTYRALPVPGFPLIPAHWDVDETILELSSSYKPHSIRGRVFFKKGTPLKRVMILVHGQGEQGGRYQHFPHYLDESLDAIVALDLVGHGKSDGSRGHVEYFDQYTEDVMKIRTWTEEWLKKVHHQTESEFHLFGHSMGGLIALRFLFTYPYFSWSSVTISSPALQLKMKAPWWKVKASKILAKTLPSLPISSGLKAFDLSHNPEVVALYSKDPLNHDLVTPKFYEEFVEAMSDTLSKKDHAEAIQRYPTLFVISMEDRICDPEVNLDFANHLDLREKKVLPLEGYYHESFNEIQKEKPFEELKNWILKHTK